ncbi:MULTISPECIES: endonuclease/exonuclease/phosphatase family protein [Nocardioides]|uniref:Endonuclease/exonuclease/phosphatase family protein n=1 Tax=Nocardioides vastitatis TaxID=2568655 RepID=A0ABW0Z9D3_9ACTN|nr:endonuclease/exonuclease/phosphatase family protein [Nocardioides sp.]THJ15082.1 endonuclease [Nocardioides sp.]
MRIVSLNAWGGAMHDELVAWLPLVDADVVCLQEVTRTHGLDGWTRFEDDARSLPQRADLMADVAAVLPQHTGWFTVSDTGPVTSDTGAAHRQHFGLAMFVREELAQVGLRAGYVHGEYADHGPRWPHSGRPRAAQVVRLFDHGTDRFVTVGHLHGLRDGAGKGDSPVRRAQAERLVALLAEVRQADDLVVVCGDLNVMPDSETFAVLAGAGVTDLVRDADTRTAHYAKAIRHASYLLVSDPSAVKSFEVVASPEVSDHRALLLEV